MYLCTYLLQLRRMLGMIDDDDIDEDDSNDDDNDDDYSKRCAVSE